jgi:hypothetical protein
VKENFTQRRKGAEYFLSLFNNEALNKRAYVILRGVERLEESLSHSGILQLVKLASE